MKQEKSPRNLNLSLDDLQAIIYALPLAYYVFGDSSAEDIIVSGCIESSGEKLLNMLHGGSASFTYAESYTIANAIAAALDVVSGCAPEIAQELDDEQLKELRSRIFVLNHLHTYYKKIM